MKNNNFKKSIVTVIVIFTHLFLIADYTVSVEDYYTGTDCVADITVFIEGDAGPFTIELFDGNGGLIEFRGDLIEDLHIISQVPQQVGLMMRITDRFGCSEDFDDLYFKCECAGVEPTVNIQHDECNDKPGTIDVFPIVLPSFHSVSVQWHDDPSLISLKREGLRPGEYCGTFTMLPFRGAVVGGGLGGPIVGDLNNGNTDSFTPCIVDLCFTIDPCYCNDYEPLANISRTRDGLDNGAIELTLQNGTGPITYDWEHVATGTNYSGNPIDGLATGLYSVTIQDSSCDDNVQVEVYEVKENCWISESGQMTIVQDPTGCDRNDGQILNGALEVYEDMLILNSNYDLTWTWVNDQTGETMEEHLEYQNNQLVRRGIVNLSPGSYTLKITNINGCYFRRTYYLEEAQGDIEINDNSISVTPACDNQQFGQISIRAISWSHPNDGYTVEWSNGISENIEPGRTIFESTIGDLSPGIYTVTVTSLGDNCSLEEDFDVAFVNSDPLEGLNITVAQPACNGRDNGIVVAEAIGGTGPFLYEWNSGIKSESGINSSVSPGPNSVTVTDNCGEMISKSFDLANCNLDIDYTIKHPTPNENNGNITLLFDNDCTSPITVEWLQGINSNDSVIEGLGEGHYRCHVYNEEGCSTYLDFYLEECLSDWNPEFSSNVIEFNCNGRIKLEIQGQDDEYSYRVMNDQGEFESGLLQPFDINISSFARKYELDLRDLVNGSYTLLMQRAGSCDWMEVYNWVIGCAICTDQVLNMAIDEPCGPRQFFGLTVDPSNASLIGHNEIKHDYFIEWWQESVQVGSAYVYRNDNGKVKINGDNHIDLSLIKDNDFEISLIVTNINLGCSYVVSLTVGGRIDYPCFVEPLNLGFIRAQTVYNSNDIPAIYCSSRGYTCGEIIESTYGYSKIEYTPFDKTDPCYGGGIAVFKCTNYLRDGDYVDDRFFVIPPDYSRSKYSEIYSYTDLYIGRGIWNIWNCESTGGRLCFFDYLNLDYPLVVEACPDDEVIVPENPYEELCDGIIYPYPVLDEGRPTCSYFLRCLNAFGEDTNLTTSGPIQYPESDCCYTAREEENGTVCELECYCDFGFYNGNDETEITCLSANHYEACEPLELRVVESEIGCRTGYTFTISLFKIGSHNIEMHLVNLEQDNLECDDLFDNDDNLKDEYKLEEGVNGFKYNFDFIGTTNISFDIKHLLVDIKAFDFNNCLIVKIDGEQIVVPIYITPCFAKVNAEPKGCELDLKASNYNDKYFIDFKESFEVGADPVVMAGPPSFNGADKAIIRVNEINENGFEVQLKEWLYRDGGHTTEQVSYFYTQPGRFNFGGLSAEIGFIDDVNHNYKDFSFTAPFDSPPVVIVTQVTNVHETPAAQRMRNITESGLQIRLQEEDGNGNNTNHAKERISYIAIEQGVGFIGDKRIVVGSVPGGVDHNWKVVNIDDAFSEKPLLFAKMQTVNGQDLAVMRYRNLTGSSFELKVDEEQSSDQEVTHNFEDIGYILIESNPDLCECPDDPMDLSDHILYYPSCGENNGSISLNPIGNGPFTYEWSNGEVGSQINGLAPGNYSVTVTDSDGCIDEGSFSIDGSNFLGVLETIVHPSCGGSNGTINLEAYGGTSPYLYIWDNGDLSPSRTGLSAGNYFVTVVDSDNCYKHAVIRLQDFHIDDYQAINAICGFDNGSIRGGGAFGNEPYTYLWSNGETTQELADLAPGNYHLTVTDASGCTAYNSFIIDNVNELRLNASGGDQGFTEEKYLGAGTTLHWEFSPQRQADQLIITSSSEGVLINTGRVTTSSFCSCNGHSTCICADLYLGDNAGQTVPLVSGFGTVSAPSGNCQNDISIPYKAYDLFGSFTLSLNGDITIEVLGSSCGTSGTRWNLDVECGTNTMRRSTRNLDMEIELEEVSSFNNSIEFDFKMFPNPTKDLVYFEFSNFYSDFNVSIFDMTGRRLKSIIGMKESNFHIDLSEINPGVYIVVADDGQNKVVQRLMVQ